MQFDVLRLSGFKSFVDHTEMPLSPGLTGLVGPNGCGKSNVLEAMRWVMGETSAKSMRGDGMEDVIFAGAASRPPKNFAEVSLLIDNSEERAPSPFTKEPTLEIARRITRNAGSAYRVNGQEVRARDVKVMFADAATGAQSPSLVRQGQIGLLIAAKPTARRRLLEDAAGVAGLYERRREVEQRLKAADENLTRIEELITRLEGQIGSLRRQAKQAEKYTELSEKIKEATAELAWRRYRAADVACLEAGTALEEASRAVAAATTDQSEKERAKTEADSTLPSLREEEAIARALHQKLLSKREALELEARRVSDAKEQLERSHQQTQTDLTREQELARDAEEALTNLLAEKAQFDEQGQDDALIPSLEAALLDTASLVTKAEESRDTLAAQAAGAQAARETGETNLRRTEQIHQNLQKRFEEAKSRQSARDATLAEAKEKSASCLNEVENAESAFATANAKFADAERALPSLIDAVTQARSKSSAEKARRDALRAESQSLQKAIEADEKSLSPAAVLHSVTVKPGYEAAFGAAIGPEGGAAEANAFRHDAEGWVTLGPLEMAQMNAEPLSNFVDAPSPLKRWLDSVYVIGREAGAAMQSRLPRGITLVSVEGDLWRWDGYFAGGEIGTAESRAASLQRKNRMAAVSSELSETEDRAQALADALTKAEEDHKSAAALEQEARRALKNAEDQQALSLRQRDDANAAVIRAQEAIESDRAEYERLTEALTESQSALTKAQTEFESLADPETLLASLRMAHAALETARQKRDSARAEHEAALADERRRADRLTALQRELSDWESRKAKTSQRSEDLQSRLNAINEQREAAQNAPERIADELEALATEAQTLETRLTNSLDALAEAEAKQADQSRALSEANKTLSTARETLARAETVQEAAELRKVEASNALDEEAGDTIEALAERFAGEDADPSEIEERLHKARASRDRLGAVNLRAAEEIAESETESEGLISEKEELEEAIAKLRSGLAVLNKEGRTRLMDAFNIVNANFSTLFTHLFGGGEASLQMTESDDPLEAGLEIICQPPGKRVQTLSLMSGGEQTLTAMALIFAVFMVNPAPVCVLDEVDAPLDDANVARFCDLLLEMTRRTDARFLVITHHALTMSRMDRLFGVTMVERGVSRLVSVDLEKAVEMVDAG